MVANAGLIVLHTTKFGENSFVVHTLSREYGRRGFLVRNAGRKAAMAFFMPLSIVEADIVESSKSKLYTAKNLTSRYPLLGIRSNLHKNTMSMFMSEVIYRVVKDGVYEEGLYEWCEKNILLLDAMKTDFSNFHIRFLLELSVQLGFGPEAGDLMPFVGEHHAIVEKFMNSSFAESMLIPLNGSLRNAISEGILRYIEHHTDSALNINSLRVLHELYR